GEAFFSNRFQGWCAYILVGSGKAGRGGGTEYYKGAYSQDPNAFVEVMLPMLFGKPVTSSGAAATVIGAAVNDEATARANADSAAATRISNVEVRAGDLEGTAGTLQTAITDINGKISTRWAAQAVSPGGRA
ncbi:hypothetical protein, partial [Parvimonas sp. D9]